MIRPLTALALLLAGTASAQTLARVEVRSEDAPALAVSLSEQGFDVLEGSVSPGRLEVVASDAELVALGALGVTYDLVERGRPFRDIQAEDAGTGTAYEDLQGVMDFLTQTAADHPDIAQLVDLTAKYGTPPTFEGRSMYALKISDNVTQEEDEPTFMLVSAHHCRELVTPVIAMHGITDLTDNYGIDPAVTSVVDDNEIWMIPVWNPDGYNHVFTVDNLWRKNRRILESGIGVDLNRNYPFGWTSACSGSTSVGSQTYKGPGPASEPETITMMAFSDDQRFHRVIDLHSFGEEVLYGFLCASSPLTNYWLDVAEELSTDCGYAGATRPPTAEGEHYQWQIARGALSFLIETHTTFQPSFTSACNEAMQVWPGIRALFAKPAPVSGHVTDLCTDLPVEAEMTIQGIAFPNGETVSSDPEFGFYEFFLPSVPVTLDFDAAGYATSSVATTASTSGTVEDPILSAVTTLTSSGTNQIGTSTTFDFDSVSDAGRLYIGLMSATGTSPGLPMNNCGIPLNFDVTTLLPTKSPAVFQKFVGTLDGGGSATGTFVIPGDPTLVGVDVDFAYFTVDGGTGLAVHASNAEHVQIQS